MFLSACFGRNTEKKHNTINTNKQIPAVALQSDIVYFKFLNAETYELDVSKIQIWVFNKKLYCVHGSDNERQAQSYLQKHIDDIHLKEDIFKNFKDIHSLALNGIETKRTVMINNSLVYIEGKALYYNEDINDIYASMVLYLPYRIVPAAPRSSSYERTLLYTEHNSIKQSATKRRDSYSEKDLKMQHDLMECDLTTYMTREN